jgi:Tol biopolymer transport system component
MKRLAPAAASFVFVLSLAGPAEAYPRPGVLERVSVASDGTETDGYAAYPSISDDGRFVVFDSQASALVPGDTNELNDIFVHDRVTRRTELVSVSSDEQQTESPAYLARIDPSGSFVLFQSGSTKLAPGASGFGSVFLRDLREGTTELVSMSSDEEAANSLSFPGNITPDGRFVSFQSFASNLAPGDTNDKVDVFVRDRVEGTTTRVSLRADGNERVGDSSSPSLSDDGRFVAYTALVGTQGEDRTDFIDEMQVFWHDRDTGDVRLISVSSDGRRGNAFSSDAHLSADGRYVAFQSMASNLVPGDANQAQDIFLHDTETRTTRRISVSSAGEESNGRSFGPIMGRDGRYVAFGTAASNLSAGDTNGRNDSYVHDLASGVTERVSLGSAGQEPTSHSENVFVSAGGRHVAFANYSPLVPEDQNDARDIFVLDRGPSTGVGALSAVRDGEEVDVSGWATFSGTIASGVHDGAGDAVQGGAELGADLTGAQVVFRPEIEDLLLRMSVTALPSVRSPQASGLAIACGLGNCGAGVSGAAGVTYSMSLELDGSRYEVRAERGASPAAVSIHLLECDGTCMPVQTLSGSIGVTGDEVVVSVPLAAIGAEPGDTIEGIAASAGPGHPLAGTAQALDQVSLPDAALPVPTVTVEPGPAAGSEDLADLSGGMFSARIPWIAGADHVTARACLGEDCDTTVAPISS